MDRQQPSTAGAGSFLRIVRLYGAYFFDGKLCLPQGVCMGKNLRMWMHEVELLVELSVLSGTENT